MGKNSKSAQKKLDSTTPSGDDAKCAVKPCEKGKAFLKVKVVEKGKASHVFVKAKAKASGASSLGPKDTDAGGIANFGAVTPGAYKANATLDAEDAKKFIGPELDVDGGSVAEGEHKTITVEIEPLNIVNPKIEVEYKVVLLDPGMSGLPTAEPSKIWADPTYIEISYTETNKAHAYKKGGKLDGAGKVDMFLDEKCTKATDGKIKPEQIDGGKKLKVWLRGKVAGKFNLTFTLDDPADRFIRLDKNPATEEMGVVELKLQIFQFLPADLDALEVDPGTDPVDTYRTKLKDKALPDQKELAKADKAGFGRLLHVQSKGNFWRSKVVLAKLDLSQWPDPAKEYEVVLAADNKSGGVTLFDKEEEGAKQKLPIKVKASDLTADKVYWAEGESAVSKAGGVRLEVGVDRASGGLSKSAKHNGDWGRFTVVKIKEVKFKFANSKDKAVIWNSSKNRFYVNTDADPDGRTLKTKKDVRTISVTASLTEKIEKVRIHFMLAAGKANPTGAFWGASLPATFDYGKMKPEPKAKDKSDPKKVLHLYAETKDTGVAEIETLVLSRLGGETFKIGAYIVQDPQLAKYVEDHPDLKKKEPVLSSDKIEIWRKMCVQISRNKNTTIVSRSLTHTAYGADQVWMEIEEIDEVKFDKASIAGLAEHPKWQFDPGSGTDKVICVGQHNKTKFHGLMKAETDATKPKIHLIMVDQQWDPELGKLETKEFTSRTLTYNCRNAAGNDDLGVFNPPLQGGAIIATGTWTWNDGGQVHTGTLTDADLKVKQARASYAEVEVTLPNKCAAACACGGNTEIRPTNAKKATANLQLNGANGPWAGESGSPGSPHCLIKVKTDANRSNNIIAHEIGHLYHEVRKEKTWLGVPDHPDQYVRRGGSGSHCKKDAGVHATAKDQDGNSVYTAGSCVMFHVAIGNVTFCDNCRLDLRARDVTQFFKGPE